MLTAMSTLVAEAYRERYAIAAFNTYNYASMRAVFETAAELDSPVILAFGENVSHVMDLDSVVAVTSSLAKHYPVRYALHLDHAKSFSCILKAIRAGFSSVMYDGSLGSFQDNVEQTRYVVDLAHTVGVSVEAELGAVAAGDDTDEEDAAEQLTDPSLAAQFVDLTHVDALAVSVGTVHGLYRGEPKIDLERLQEIRSQVAIPLVLHGGSGTPEAILREAISLGVAKVNVNTEVSKAGVMTLSESLAENPGAHLSHLTMATKDGMKPVLWHYIQVLTILPQSR